MDKKIITGGVLLALLLLLATYFFRDSLLETQTSLVKYYNGSNYQCVAYVERYYQNMFGITIKSVGAAMNLAKKAPKYGLYFHENGGVVVPQVGDILVFGNQNKIGHVAIITGVLKDGVLIVEQNWYKAKITNNKGKALPATYKDGHYTILDRYYNEKQKKESERFWIMGWVSRHKQNPGTFFDFTDDNDQGWLPENDLKYYTKGDKNSWSWRVTGKDPRILSPVFLDGLSAQNFNSISLRARVKGGKNAQEGVLYIRDRNDQWSKQISFPVNFSQEEYQEVNVDLKSLPKDLKITQIMLKLTGDGVRRGEIWNMDWLRISDRSNGILEGI